jgi:ethanolamine utilization protein EutQ
MSQTLPSVSLFTADKVPAWLQSEHRQVFIGDVLDASNSASMGVGFARYAPGESNEWFVTYDEALVVTRGAFTVTSADGYRETAAPGDVIFLRRDTKLVYSAGEAGAELVYVMYPLPSETNLFVDHADLVATFRPAGEAPPRFGDLADDNLELMRRIWEPAVRGDYDLAPFVAALAEDVEFKTPVGSVRGKRAVIDYFARGAATLDFQPFLGPVRYYASGDVVVMTSEELFTVKETGASLRSDWAWAHEIHDGRITRITVMQHLGGIEDHIRRALG